ncbi:hypothetical protein WUBG_12536, partial [Wuchereria bancrofti]
MTDYPPVHTLTIYVPFIFVLSYDLAVLVKRAYGGYWLCFVLYFPPSFASTPICFLFPNCTIKLKSR